jgi:hypothetical protein
MAAAANNQIRRTDVERVVREVLSGINARGARRAGAPAGGELRLTKKLVTLADVEGRLEGVRQVVIAGGAVLTPAARDELKKFAVAIASAVPAKPAATEAVCACIVETRCDARALAAAIENEVSAEWLAAAELPAAVDGVCGRVAGGGLGVLLTSGLAAALCLANRKRGVRAALGSSVAATDAAIASISANLLVVDPAGLSVFALRQLLRTWVRGRRDGSGRFGKHLD